LSTSEKTGTLDEVPHSQRSRMRTITILVSGSFPAFLGNIIIFRRSGTLHRESLRLLVYCDMCGIESDRHDRYCRICGREVTHPSRLWGIRHRPTGHRGGVTAVLEEASTTSRNVTPEITLDDLKPEQTMTRPGSNETEEPAPAEPREKLIAKIQQLEKEKDSLRDQVWKDRKRPSALAGYGLAGVGGLSLILSVVFTSTVLAFIGLGLLFWGALLLFIRPRKYVRSELMDSTALSSLKTVDRFVRSLGYTQKGVYIPVHNPEKTVAFIPAQPNSKLPAAEQLEEQIFVKDPDGIAMIPPGLSLANLFERELGVKFTELSLQDLAEKLPKLLIDDLEMVQDCEIKIDGNNVRFKFVESVYSEFCSRLRESTEVCSSLGCPLCSAMACVLAEVSAKPVEFDKDNYSSDGKTIESSYHILASS